MRLQFDDAGIDWNELSHLYRIAPLGDKKSGDLKLCFGNSLFKCFVFDGDALVEEPMSLISIPIEQTMIGRHWVYES